MAGDRSDGAGRAGSFPGLNNLRFGCLPTLDWRVGSTACFCFGAQQRDHHDAPVFPDIAWNCRHHGRNRARGGRSGRAARAWPRRWRWQPKSPAPIGASARPWRLTSTRSGAARAAIPTAYRISRVPITAATRRPMRTSGKPRAGPSIAAFSLIPASGRAPATPPIPIEARRFAPLARVQRSRSQARHGAAPACCRGALFVVERQRLRARLP